MPNWCWNYAVFTHEDKDKIEMLDSVFSSGNLVLEEMKVDLPLRDWICEDWCRNSENEIQMTFDTAWSPPIEFYEHMVKEGFKVHAEYHESGMGFVGSWNDEEGDDYWEYIEIFEKYHDEWRDNIPEDYHQMIEDEYEYWKESKENEF